MTKCQEEFYIKTFIQKILQIYLIKKERKINLRSEVFESSFDQVILSIVILSQSSQYVTLSFSMILSILSEIDGVS